MLVFTDILRVKNFAEIALSCMVFEIQVFLSFFAIFAKNAKIQNGHHFWWDKKFLETGSPTQKNNPEAKKFCRNCSI